MSSLKIVNQSGGSVTLTSDGVSDVQVYLPDADAKLIGLKSNYYSPAQIYALVATTGGHGTSMVFDSVGNLYWAVINSTNNTAYTYNSYVYRITPDGVLSTWATAATYNGKDTALVIDAQDNLYWAVTNYYNGTTRALTSYVYRITPAGALTTWASQATTGGWATALAWDAAGNLYWAVTQQYNSTTYTLISYVYKITPAGIRTTWASQSAIAMAYTDLAFDSAGNLYWALSPYSNGLAASSTYLYRIDAFGVKSLVSTQSNTDTAGTRLVFDSVGNLYWGVTDRTTGIGTSIYRIDISGYVTLLLSRPSADKQGLGFLLDTDGTLYCILNTTTVDYLYVIKPDGSLTLLASVEYSGTLATRRCYLAVDAKGNIYIAISVYYEAASYLTTSRLYRLTKRTLNA